MPVQAWKTRILIDQFDFSGETSGGSLALTVRPIDAPALQQPSMLYVPGAQNGKLEFGGYWNGGAAGRLDDELYRRLGSQLPCIVITMLDTSALGNPAYVLRSTWNQQINIEWPAAGLLTAQATFEDVAARGLVVAHQSFTAVGLGPLIDFGAAGTAGAWAVLVVRAVEGSASNAAFVVRASNTTDFATPISLISFAPVAGVGAQMAAAAGDVRRYLRLWCSDMGGATKLTVTAVVGVAGVTG